MTIINIPEKIKKYLWDIKIEKLEESHSHFIIERLLEFGDLEDLKWLQNQFSKKEIISVLKKSRRISPKTGYFYSFYYQISPQDLLCMKKPFTQRQNRF